MKNKIIILTLLRFTFLYILPNCHEITNVFAQSYEFAKSVGSTNNDEESRSMDIDGSGNVYLTGHFKSTAYFGSGNPLTSNGGDDIFFAKYNSNGNNILKKNIGGTGNDRGYGIAVSTSGIIVVTGKFTGTVDFDPGFDTANLTAVGGDDIFLAYYLSNGNFLWAINIGGINDDIGYSIAVDADVNIYVTGYFSGTADFDPDSGIYNLTAFGLKDIYVAKYDNNGNFNWAKNIGSANSDCGQHITIDASNNLYLTGYFEGSADFDPGAGVANLTSNGNKDIFYAKFNNLGNYLWAKKIGSTGEDVGNCITVDATNNVFISGYFSGTADFDPGAGAINLNSNGNKDVFFAKYTSNGIFSWAHSAGSILDDRSNSITIDSYNNIWFTGTFSDTVDFNSGIGTNNLTALGTMDIFFSKYDNSGNFILAKSIGGIIDDVSYSIGVNPSNNYIYISGYFGNTVDFDPNISDSILKTADSADIYLAKYTDIGNVLGVNTISSVNDDAGYKIKVDAFGNIYIMGYYAGTTDFDPGVGVSILTHVGGTDVFFAKYDATGNFLWAKGIGASGNDNGKDMVIDSFGNIYIIGSFFNTMDFDPGNGTALLTSAGNSDAFFAKYDSVGNYVWSKCVGGSGLDMGSNIAINDSGFVFITGNYANTADFDPGPDTASLYSFCVNELFFAKYDSLGNYIWAKTGASGIISSQGLSIDDSSNLYITGYFYDYTDLNPAGGTTIFSSGSSDIFIVKYNASGNYIWAKTIGSTYVEQTNSIAVDKSGNICITGTFSGNTDFNPDAGIANLAPVGSRDIFIAKFTNNGNYIWAKNIGSTGQDAGSGISADTSGNIYITGYFVDSADFDPGPGIVNLKSVGGSDIFFGKFDPGGNYLWAKNIGSINYDSGIDITVDGNNSCYITGHFSDTTDFDPAAGTAILTPLSGRDVFFAKYIEIIVNIKTRGAIEAGTLEIVPNPNNGQFTLQLFVKQCNSNIDVKIYNVLGDNVYNAAGLCQQPLNIDASILPNGIYLIQLSIGREVLIQKTMIFK